MAESPSSTSDSSQSLKEFYTTINTLGLDESKLIAGKTYRASRGDGSAIHLKWDGKHFRINANSLFDFNKKETTERTPSNANAHDENKFREMNATQISGETSKSVLPNTLTSTSVPPSTTTGSNSPQSSTKSTGKQSRPSLRDSSTGSGDATENVQLKDIKKKLQGTKAYGTLKQQKSGKIGKRNCPTASEHKGFNLSANSADLTAMAGGADALVKAVKLQGSTHKIVKPYKVTFTPQFIRLGMWMPEVHGDVSIMPQVISFSLVIKNFAMDVRLASCEIQQIKACFSSNLGMICILADPVFNQCIRKRCKVFANENPLYDPSSENNSERYVMIMVSQMTVSLAKHLRRVMQLLTQSEGVSSSCQPFYKEIDSASMRSMYQSVYRNTQNPIEPTVTFSDPTPGSTSDVDAQLCSRSASPPPTAYQGPAVKLFTFPPPPEMGGITVTGEDLFCLNDGEFLNDVIIDFYLKYLYGNNFSEKNQQRTYIFSSFFYRCLTDNLCHETVDMKLTNAQKRHGRVKTWTRHVDLFEKDFIIVPINQSAHWYLAIICFPWAATPLSNSSHLESDQRPCIILFDSLRGTASLAAIKVLREYLQVEWDVKKAPEYGVCSLSKDAIPGIYPPCPQQTNFSDCGVYSLQYVEQFFSHPILDYRNGINVCNWFDEKVVQRKRRSLIDLIDELRKKLNPLLNFEVDSIITKC